MVANLPLLDVILAVYEPDLVALGRQIEGVLAQTGCRPRLTLFVDGPMPQLPAIVALASRHPAVAMVGFPENRGPAATFLEGLAHVLAAPEENGEERYFAFCDQDDLWHADKFQVSLVRLRASGAAAVHSDARVVNASLCVVAPSLFDMEGRQRDPRLAALFFRNNATGMTLVMEEPLARQVAQLRHLRPERWLHDHFVAFVAAAGAGLVLEPRALVDYVQHGGNMVGAGGASMGLPILPSFGFLDPHGAAARWIEQGADLVAVLLAMEDLPQARRAELAALHRLLVGRGIADLPRAAAALWRIPRISRALVAQLLWARLAR